MKVLTLVLGLLFLALVSCFAPVKASPLTTVTLSLQEETPEVDVSPGSSGIVSVTGEVTCRKIGPDPVKVFLQASSDFGSAPVTPSNLVFSQTSGTEETEPFTVDSRVPMGTSSSATLSITVQGYYDQGGLRSNIQPVSTMIIILQYYKIEVLVEKKEVSVNSGENADLEFNVVNVGNGEDSFVIDIQNRDFLNSKGFSLPAPLEIQMLEDENRNLSLEIGAPEGGSGNYMVEISVLSEGSYNEETPEMVVKYIEINVVGGIGDHLVNFLTSPLVIIVLIILVVVVLYVRMKKREKIQPTRG